jgi:hypothetical protein
LHGRAETPSASWSAGKAQAKPEGSRFAGSSRFSDWRRGEALSERETGQWGRRR